MFKSMSKNVSLKRSLLVLNQLISGHCNCLLGNYGVTSTTRFIHHVCIIGSGPAGFYAAQHLIKLKPSVHVDIYEKLPVPFGLVRYGVAPDHPEVKNVINTFTTVLKNPKVSFRGNVEAGKDITFTQLQQSYDAILLSYGASEDRKLDIPGEKEYVTSAREFVGWYNGLPENRDLQINLETKKRAVIIGHGNVALDIARILLSPIEILEQTDISPYALEALRKSDINEVVVCGRRGPLHISFTIKELRELFNLAGVKSIVNPKDFNGIDDNFISSLPRPKKRITDLMYKNATIPKLDDKQSILRTWFLKFFRSPLKVEENNGKLQLTLGINELDPSNSEKVISTGNLEIDNCDLVFRSVGYKGKRLFTEIPFDETTGIVPNVSGRVQEGVYCCGWVGQGPRGVILSTMSNAFEVAKIIAQDLDKLNSSYTKGGFNNIKVGDKRITGFDDYLKIATFECTNNRKVTTIEEMLKIVNHS